jgi:hypothetical protein
MLSQLAHVPIQRPTALSVLLEAPEQANKYIYIEKYTAPVSVRQVGGRPPILPPVQTHIQEFGVG